ncbi:egl-4 [Symbiodinium sp. CCMP2456]|nr:egl-4 [Symbiodinium sp. CCMP2456]
MDAEKINDQEVKILEASLASVPIFQGCEEFLIKQIAKKAQCRRYDGHEEIVFSDQVPLLVVLSGAVRICIGCAPDTDAGPGSVLNVPGMLGLHELAEPYKPKAGKPASDPNDDLDDCVSMDPKTAQGPLKDEVQNIYNLCPISCYSSQKQTNLSGWLRMDIKPADSAGAKVAMVSLDLVEKVLAKGDALRPFHANLSRLTDQFICILRHGMFPGVPPEVIWLIACGTQRRHYAPKETLVEEDDLGELADWLIAINSGKADVEKLSYNGEEAVPQTIGSLSEGAVMGDVCFLHGGVPRGATVRAQTEVDAIAIPPSVILDALAMFPGITSSFMGRLREIVMQLQGSLPRPAQALKGMQIFSSCDLAFLRAVASVSERKVFFAGDQVREEGIIDDTLRVIEFGRCRVERRREGGCGVEFCGSCEVGTVLGERRFFNMPSMWPDATFRIATPLALLLFIPRQSFNGVLDNYPSEQQRFRLVKENTKTDGGNAKREHDAASLTILQGCGSGFLQAIAGCIRTVTYKIGQTITVQGAVDSGSMYIIKGGSAEVFVNHRYVKDVHAGDSFGELTILGFVKRRSAVVRAKEICIVLEMPRAAFIAALEDHPEEQEHFQKIGRQHGVVVSSTQWPLFVGASPKLLSLINLYARKHITAKGLWSTFNGEQLPEQAAILVLRGEIRMITPDKGELVFVEGTCFNEQLLFGLPPLEGKLQPQGNCEVQIMTAEIFDRVVSECPSERDFIMQRIVNEIARKAEQTMGFQRGDLGGALVLSTVIQVAADEFADQLRKRIDARIYEPGMMLTDVGQEGETMFVLVEGEAENEGDGTCRGRALRLKSGSVIGESVLLGVARTYPNRIRAVTRCIALALTRAVFRQVLEEFPSHVELYSHMSSANPEQSEPSKSALDLQEHLHKSRAFSNVSKDFLSVVCERADEVYFGPGDDIFRRGEVCKLGEAIMYILLQGAAIVEGEYGDELGRLNPGDVVGEGGALGIAPTRGATVRAWRDTLVRAVRLHGTSIQRAITAFPDEYESLQAIFQKRASANKEVERVRQKWLQEQVIPALNKCRIFNGFPEHIIRKIAEHLLQATYTSGQIVCVAGNGADSMIIFLKGEGEVHAKSGDLIGTITPGAMIGEVSVLGLFPWRTATIRATSNADAVLITANLITRILQGDDAAEARARFEALRQERCDQVEQGMPLCTLPLDVSVKDVAARAVALHAIRFDFATGDVFKPNSKSQGPHYWILVQGTMNLMMGSRHIMLFSAGPVNPLIPEHVAQDFGATLHAATPCEAYRVGLYDILLATHCVRAKWYKHFEKLLEEVQVKVRLKLQGARSIQTMKLKKSRTEVSLHPMKKEEEGLPAALYLEPQISDQLVCEVS